VVSAHRERRAFEVACAFLLIPLAKPDSQISVSRTILGVMFSFGMASFPQMYIDHQAEIAIPLLYSLCWDFFPSRQATFAALISPFP